MAAAPARLKARRRPGSPARPINARAYRGTWLLVGIPLLIAAFSLRTAPVLPPPALPPTFDGSFAVALAHDLATLHPNRRPGTQESRAAARWVAARLRDQQLRPQTTRFRAALPGGRTVSLRNVEAEIPGRSPDPIVIVAHRDNTGASPGANDNASGTAAMIELARAYAGSNPCSAVRTVGGLCPAHRIVFLSTDAGSYGGLGAERFAKTSPFGRRILAVLNLDSLAAARPPRVVTAGLSSRSSPPGLVRTAGARVLDAARTPLRRASALAQLLDLGFPLTLYEQGPFLRLGIPALTLTTSGERPPDDAHDTPDRLNRQRLAQLGSAAQELIASVDQGLAVSTDASSSVFLGSRYLPGWALELVLIACVLPFVVAVVDLFARCRRRQLRLAPAWRSLRSRLGFWLWVGIVCAILGVAGLWPRGPGLPPPPSAAIAGDWPAIPLVIVCVLALAGWLVTRERLLPRRPAEPEELLAGYTVALLGLAVVAFLVIALNPFALVYLLPSLHAWLWLSQLAQRPFALRLTALAAGLLGPALLLGSLAFRFDLGLDAPWYLALLVVIGYVPLPAVVVTIAWLAVGGQLAALAGGRYAPYPSRRERSPRGLLREGGRRMTLAWRRRNRPGMAPAEDRNAAEEIRPG